MTHFLHLRKFYNSVHALPILNSYILSSIIFWVYFVLHFVELYEKGMIKNDGKISNIKRAHLDICDRRQIWKKLFPVHIHKLARPVACILQNMFIKMSGRAWMWMSVQQNFFWNFVPTADLHFWLPIDQLTHPWKL